MEACLPPAALRQLREAWRRFEEQNDFEEEEDEDEEQEDDEDDDAWHFDPGFRGPCRWLTDGGTDY